MGQLHAKASLTFKPKQISKTEKVSVTTQFLMDVTVRKKEEQILVNVLGENTLSWESQKNLIEGPLQRLVWVHLVAQQ